MLFGPKQIQVDHTVACGSLLGPNDLPTFVDRLFNGEQKVMCKPCHKEKTAREKLDKRTEA